MRFDSLGRIATNHEGRAIAHWHKGQHFFQQPVNPAAADTPDNPWQMALRTAAAQVGRGVAQGGMRGGATFWAARGATWVKQLEANTPRLAASIALPDPNGRVGDVDHDETVLTLSDDRLTFWVNNTAHRRTQPDDASGTRLIDGLVSWCNGGRVHVYDTGTSRLVRTEQIAPGATYAIAFKDADGDEWVAYQTDALGGVLHPLSDASVGYRYGTPGAIYDPEWFEDGAGGRLGWSDNKGCFGTTDPVTGLLVWPRLDVDVLGQGMVPLNVPAPAPQVPLTAPDASTFAWVGTFKANGAGGNLSIGPHPAKAIICMAEEVSQVDPARLLGLWTAHERWANGTETTLAERIAQIRPIAEALCVPLFVYDDQRGYRHSAIKTWCGSTPYVAMPQWYIGANESADDFEAFCRAELLQIRKTDVMPVVRCYTSNGTVPVAQVVRGLNAVSRVLDPFQTPGYALFAHDRKDGAVSHPDLLAASTAWTAGGEVPADNARAYAATFYPTDPIPVEPPVSQSLPAPVLATIRRFAEAFPPPQGDPGVAHEERCRVWTRCLCEQVCATHGPEWGHKRASETRPPSKETLARRVGATLSGWDLLIGASTGAPRLSSDPDFHDLVAEGNQVFIPVPATDRLGRRSARPALPANLRGVSAFDLGARFAGLDSRWLTDPRTVAIPVHRVMVSRQSGNSPRTLAQGRAQLAALLPALVARGLKAYVTLLCDTRGYTRAEMADHVAQCDDILVQYPAGVAAVELANEIGHPTQSPDLMDIDFLESLDALIGLRFPLAWGGEFEGGSFIDLHADRGTSAGGNGVELARRQQVSGKPVLSGEPLGIAEVGQTAGRQRTDNPLYGDFIAVVARQYGYGVVLHLDAGLDANVDQLGPVQTEALRLFASESGTVPVPPTPPAPPTPPTPPTPGTGILDAPLPAPIGTSYPSWLALAPHLTAISAWVTKANGGAAPAPDQMLHALYRVAVEGPRWGTLRAALREWLPGGE